MQSHFPRQPRILPVLRTFARHTLTRVALPEFRALHSQLWIRDHNVLSVQPKPVIQ
jgi:hypothetical protein